MFDKNTSRLYILAEELKMHFENENIYKDVHSLKELNKVFPKIDNEEALKVLSLLKIQHVLEKKSSNSAEIVVTSPALISHDFRNTVGILREYIHNAEKSILITGYSISEFANDIIRLLILKCKEGVQVKFFIAKNVKEEIFKDAIKNLNFTLYKYQENGQYSNLHAKIMIIDSEKAFISSSNLSYNGIINNLEIGSIVTGDSIKSLEEIFGKLIEKKYFKRIT